MEAVEKRIEYLTELVKSGGPEPEQYDALRKWMDETGILIENKSFSDEETKLFYENIGLLFPVSTIQGLTYHKPFGYPGDFELLDRIHSSFVTSDTIFSGWDKYFHSCAAPKAVRNRKEIFKFLLKEKIKDRSTTLNVLNIASGPCRDICEFFNENPDADIVIDCLEHDEKAIEYAKSLNTNHLNKISFIKGNIMRFHFEKQYDFIWSGGLFDYFSDSVFLRILNKLICNTVNGGEIVIGNFAVSNPSKYFMLLFDWVVFHRSKEQLISFAEQCGVDKNNISVDIEKEQVNLFLHIKKAL